MKSVKHYGIEIGYGYDSELNIEWRRSEVIYHDGTSGFLYLGTRYAEMNGRHMPVSFETQDNEPAVTSLY